MTIIQSYSIAINWNGTGMSSYSQSFSTYLIQTTLGILLIIEEIMGEMLIGIWTI
jgi:hypothetical protein